MIKYNLLKEEIFAKKIWRAVAVISVCLNFLLFPAACFCSPMSPEDVASAMSPGDRARVIIELQALQQEKLNR